MDRVDLQVIATVTTTIAFIIIFYWAFSKKNKQRFDEAANLPFADEEQDLVEKPNKGENP